MHVAPGTVMHIGPLDLSDKTHLAVLRGLERAAAMEEAVRATLRVFSDPRVPGWLAKLEAFAYEDRSRWENEGGAL
jgi:hypothetical protein